VIETERFTQALRAQVTDERVRRPPGDIGSIDQYVDSTDVLSNPRVRVKLRGIYTDTA